MGCCFSTNKTPTPKPSFLNVETHETVKEVLSETAAAAAAEVGISKSPPPQPLEEETVKEVLSETPTPKPSFLNVETHEIPPPSFLKIQTDKHSSPPTPSPPPPLPPHPHPSFPIKVEEAKMGSRKTLPPDPAVEEISEVSDMCSLSESVSTTTIGEGRIDDGEVRQRVDRSPAKIPRKRPVGGEFTGRTERGEKTSPARRFDQSPGRRNDNNATMKPSPVRHHHTRDMTGTGGAYTNRRRSPGSDGGVSRDPGEGSARRSRSPATRAGLGRSPSSRAVRSPARIPALGPENGRKPEESRGDEGNWNWPANESLENPLVSLECFIFL
ncbi:serine/arginine repetitive matrix protein 2 [Macadamia integrifolia]|uniref:serine/arginine repetitive matrix protein 2 n=1 Tax=Macadamia integrifolia TaxID=60698 RepID=UPI001C530A7A|nr:serine/arginine repetitive matrix protein 2 [Macadamia integrifolia]